MRRLLCLALTLLSLLPASAAERPVLVVMDFEARGASVLQAEAATRGAVRGLRQLDVFQVLSAEEVRQLLAIERSRALLGATEEPMAEMRRALGARYVVSGTVSRPESRLVVDVRLLDTEGGKVLAQKTLGPVASIETVAQELPGLTQTLVAPLLQGELGRLLVRSAEEGAEVLVDDVLVASTPLSRPLELSRGGHKLTVRKDGFIAQSRTVRVEPEQLAVEEVVLMPSPDFAETWKAHHGRQRLGAWIASGVAVLALSGAVLLDRQVTEPAWRQEFLPRQLALESAGVDTVLAADFSDAQKTRYLACAEAPGACRLRTNELAAQLRTQQTLTVGMGTLGVVSAATAVWLFLSSSDPNRYAGVVAGLTAGETGTGFALSGRF